MLFWSAGGELAIFRLFMQPAMLRTMHHRLNPSVADQQAGAHQSTHHTLSCLCWLIHDQLHPLMPHSIQGLIMPITSQSSSPVTQGCPSKHQLPQHTRHLPLQQPLRHAHTDWVLCQARRDLRGAAPSHHPCSWIHISSPLRRPTCSQASWHNPARSSLPLCLYSRLSPSQASLQGWHLQDGSPCGHTLQPSSTATTRLSPCRT